MAFQPEAFGKYYLIDKIAIGGMAEIFKAKQFGPGGFEKILVVKRILSHLSEDQDFIQMFRDEAMISSTLSHSNIVHVYDFGKIKNNYFLAMEYCDGKDLKTVMKKCQELGRPLPIEYAVYIIHEVCKALDYAHRKKDANNQEMNILHRDISPSNIMLSYDEGRVKLADFGIAKAQNASYQTKAGVLKGKFEYMSPEQASGLNMDRRSDVFSVGICLYEILTRRRLFKTDSDLKTLELIRNPLIPPPSQLNPQIPRELDSIVMRSLARRSEDRYQESFQLQQELREFMLKSTPPTSPDLIALSLSNFMREIFEREISQEKERAEIGTKAVKDILANNQSNSEETGVEENWDIPVSNSRVTSMTTSTTAMRLMIEDKSKTSNKTSMIITVIASIIVVGGGLFFLERQAVEGPGSNTKSQPSDTPNENLSQNSNSDIKPENTDTTATEKPPSAKNDNTGRVKLSSTPNGARVYISNKLVGKTPMTYSEIPLKEWVEIRFEADGYQSHTEPVQITDKNVPLTIRPVLHPNNEKPQATNTHNTQTKQINSSQNPQQNLNNISNNTSSNTPAVNTANNNSDSNRRLELFSSPSGAAVYVEGKFLCNTPCAMENGKPENVYDLDFKLEGYLPYKHRATYPSQGASKVAPALQKMEMGYLSLSIKDGLSAEIFVDGQPKGYASSLDRLPLATGKRTIFLRNQVAGLEKTFTVDIQPGQEAKRLSLDLSKD